MKHSLGKGLWILERIGIVLMRSGLKLLANVEVMKDSVHFVQELSEKNNYHLFSGAMSRRM